MILWTWHNGNKMMFRYWVPLDPLSLRWVSHVVTYITKLTLNLLNIYFIVDYVLVHEFSQAFYMILTVTVWVKALINLIVACILVDGIKQVSEMGKHKYIIYFRPYILSHPATTYMHCSLADQHMCIHGFRSGNICLSRVKNWWSWRFYRSANCTQCTIRSFYR